MNNKKALFERFGALLLACFALLGGVYATDSCSTDSALYNMYIDFNSGSPKDWNDTAGSPYSDTGFTYQASTVYEGNASGLMSTAAFTPATKRSWILNASHIEMFVNFSCTAGGGTSAVQLRDGTTPKVYCGCDYASNPENLMCNGVDTGINVRDGLSVGDTWSRLKYARNTSSNWSIFYNGYFAGSITAANVERIYLATDSTAGKLFIDKIMLYNPSMYNNCPSIDNVPPSNSSWNVTSTASLYTGESSTSWNQGGRINLSADLLSFTVTASEASNMSCRLDTAQNYTQMVAANAAYKATTTETTAHSYTLVDSITRGTHCVYCSFKDAAGNEPASGASSSGCLNIDMNRTINITNILPANNSNQTDFDVTFFFNTTDAGQCNITANSTVLGTITAIAGTNNATYTLNNNGIFEWFATCEGSTGATWLFKMDATAEISQEFGVGECNSSSTGYVLFMFLLISVSFAFLLIGLMFGWGLLGFISGFLFMISSWYIAGCVPIFAFILALIGIIIVIYFALKGVF